MNLLDPKEYERFRRRTKIYQTVRNITNSDLSEEEKLSALWYETLSAIAKKEQKLERRIRK